MRKSFIVSIVAGTFAAGLAIAASDVVSAQFFGGQVEGCPAQPDPVCARTRKRVLATYPNECHAKNDRAVVIAKGACPAVDCQMLWRPVCGRKNGKNVTYANACIAEKAAANVIAPGSCPEICVQLAGTVCAVDDDGQRKNFPSACLAVMEGARVLHPRRCLSNRACAASDKKEVCAVDPKTKQQRTYAKLCEAERGLATFLYEGACRRRKKK